MTAASASKAKRSKSKARPRAKKAEGQISDARLKLALIAAHGSQTRAAATLGCTSSNISQRLARKPSIQKAVDDALADLEADTLAMARGNVREAISTKDMTTTRWVLERRDEAYAGKANLNVALDDATLDALVERFGGDLDALRRLRASI